MNPYQIKNTNSREKNAGFTLVEMSVVLVVIGLIIGAVSIGKDLQRNAVYQQISSNFVQSWSQAYQNYFNKTGIVIGDSSSAPTLKVDGANATPGEICTTGLHGFMDAAGISMPAGRSEGSEHAFVYLDSNGNPQETTVCFQNVAWSIPSATGTYVARTRNVMVIKNLTPDLARFLDSQVDGKTDARFGSFRESTKAASTTTASEDWTIDNRRAFGDATNTNLDESQIAVVTGYFLMNN
ncbi:type II secretion system protein [Thiomicrorhabdus lithotrophica]|uniref:Prepilin-type N-terminal cleavage/methylation domain-containing protein n=1 Tax=Thiomicrorhabdus lithotrophica TaxID=2949997 RepID=A0ABY8C951_9GAMM|nr:prepilin-type N-terminal cleavage/methylation domain-containing protein [Thiomicrorhabdus lithotrophica]WEJ62496.1 prepilin-type N-terminal cleavage/methylation domain-containing protein [Thiomicrorhabdus lithotrophica]